MQRFFCEFRGCDLSAILIGGFSHAHKGRRSSACACSKLVLFPPLVQPSSETALLEVKAREERERPTVAFELFHLTDE